MTTYENILVETRGGVGLITLNRPKALNALNSGLMTDLAAAIDAFEADPTVLCMVLTGSEKAFAAGADIKEMQARDFPDTYTTDYMAGVWERASTCRKPIIAAVAGYALGGGCELAMQCDMIIAADNAKFGQPEVNLGTMPGIGGSQRLTRAVGKAKAMDLILTARNIDAVEAERCGLVARVVPLASHMEEVMKAAEKIASLSLPALLMAKEAVNRSFEVTLAEGIRFERRLFQSTFGIADRKEGMTAFIEKRKPAFTHK